MMTSSKTLQTALRSKREKVVLELPGGPYNDKPILTGSSWEIFEDPAKDFARQRQYIAGGWLTDHMR